MLTYPQVIITNALFLLFVILKIINKYIINLILNNKDLKFIY